MDFDIVLVVFFVLAVVIFLQLRSALGKRNGNERPPFDPMRKPAVEPVSTNENVVPLPKMQTRRDNDFSDIDAIAPVDSALNNSLRTIRGADRSFDPKSFIEGSTMAYEMVMTAFANGDKDTLKNLLASDVLDGFNHAIEERQKQGQSIKFSFVGIDKAEMVAAAMKNMMAEITMRIVSEVISATYDENDNLIEGDEQNVTQLYDLWTFARDTRSPNPNWQIIATDEDV